MTGEKTIEDLERELDKVEHEEQKLREQLAQTQLEQWEQQIEDLEVQLHLAAMDVRDRAEPTVANLRAQVAETRSRISSGSTNAADAAEALRHGVQAAWTDLRKALGEARDALIR
jgi:chromosome segregation ATPase